MLLGVQHEGEWYVEAPPYYVDALERVNRQRLAGSAKEEKRRQDNEKRHEEPKSRINCEEAKYYGQVLGLNDNFPLIGRMREGRPRPNCDRANLLRIGINTRRSTRVI